MENRRHLLKRAMVGCCAAVGFGSRAKADQGAPVPFIPTLEWLRQHNPEIEHISIHYHFGCWTGYAIRTCYSKHGKLRWMHETTMTHLHWENGRWICVVGPRVEGPASTTADASEYRYGYEGQRPWPNWLRKF
ncbi:MAG: hypothetical protein ACYSX1_01910 [Planctomycetota bacterium]|jgi:hypothetical protein